MQLEDGISFFRSRFDPSIIAQALADCTKWIDPACFKLLPIFAPHTYRKAPLFKADWQTRQTNRGSEKFEGNVAASKAQNKYLGIRGRNTVVRPNWACCHVWGNDDDKFQSDHAEVNDPRYFTCPANMVLLPSPLKTFTDTIPEVKAAIRYAAYLLYDFVPEGRCVPKLQETGRFLPESWKNVEDIKVIPKSNWITQSLEAQSERLLRLCRDKNTMYPRQQVLDVVKYWVRKHPNSLFSEWPDAFPGRR